MSSWDGHTSVPFTLDMLCLMSVLKIIKVKQIVAKTKVQKYKRKFSHSISGPKEEEIICRGRKVTKNEKTAYKFNEDEDLIKLK